MSTAAAGAAAAGATAASSTRAASTEATLPPSWPPQSAQPANDVDEPTAEPSGAGPSSVGLARMQDASAAAYPQDRIHHHRHDHGRDDHHPHHPHRQQPPSPPPLAAPAPPASSIAGPPLALNGGQQAVTHHDGYAAQSRHGLAIDASSGSSAPPAPPPPPPPPSGGGHIANGDAGAGNAEWLADPASLPPTGWEEPTSTSPSKRTNPTTSQSGPRKPRANEVGLVCKSCGTTDTILWRNKLDTEHGPLCNSCGLKLHRKVKAAAKTDGAHGQGDAQAGSSSGSTVEASGPARKRARLGNGVADASHPYGMDAASMLAAAAQAAGGGLLDAATPSSSLNANGSGANPTGPHLNAVATATTIPTVTGIPRRRGPGNMTIPKHVVSGYICRECGVTESSLWRYKTHPTVGPLCNGCGLKLFRTLNGKELEAAKTQTGPKEGNSAAEGVATTEPEPPKIKGKKRHKVAHLLAGVSLPVKEALVALPPHGSTVQAERDGPAENGGLASLNGTGALAPPSTAPAPPSSSHDLTPAPDPSQAHADGPAPPPPPPPPPPASEPESATPAPDPSEIADGRIKGNSSAAVPTSAPLMHNLLASSSWQTDVVMDAAQAAAAALAAAVDSAPGAGGGGSKGA